ncbi:hypothetical protein W97_08873 [Coniosporium apollinis CBS 100218]|uniref:Uncharacterized protein n=1 Tax=Coniosporium apollinis (strain CBS 100218) TaxID=1168221 RepID=R7Z697_CONA1|nr:uncharacterized protein W97_08873 [Coniosporium apollinis CBS 100218]EON69613.1 hypothetical protein W97_08873 [Coniosporium apollinis CBS 100218]
MPPKTPTRASSDDKQPPKNRQRRQDDGGEARRGAPPQQTAAPYLTMFDLAQIASANSEPCPSWVDRRGVKRPYPGRVLHDSEGRKFLIPDGTMVAPIEDVQWDGGRTANKHPNMTALDVFRTVPKQVSARNSQDLGATLPSLQQSLSTPLASTASFTRFPFPGVNIPWSEQDPETAHALGMALARPSNRYILQSQQDPDTALGGGDVRPGPFESDRAVSRAATNVQTPPALPAVPAHLILPSNDTSDANDANDANNGDLSAEDGEEPGWEDWLHPEAL